MEIRLGVVGKIVAGDEFGSYIKIIDDAESTGGILILTSIFPEMNDGYDNWVKDNDALQRYFEESGWKVDWA